MSHDTCNLRPLCPTWWTVRSGAIGDVLTNYNTLCAVLEETNKTGLDEYAMKAGGSLTRMEKFSTSLVSSYATWCLVVQSSFCALSRAKIPQPKKQVELHCLQRLTLEDRDLILLLIGFMNLF